MSDFAVTTTSVDTSQQPDWKRSCSIRVHLPRGLRTMVFFIDNHSRLLANERVQLVFIATRFWNVVLKYKNVYVRWNYQMLRPARPVVFRMITVFIYSDWIIKTNRGCGNYLWLRNIFNRHFIINGPGAPEEAEVLIIFQSLDTITELFFFNGTPFYILG